MTSPVNCPDPHPQRGPDGISHYADLEVIGSESSDCWLRCRACGAWLWLATDLGGKHEYVGGKEIDARLAERAFLQKDLDAIVEIFLRYDLPHGPAWQSDSARLDLLRKLAPDAREGELEAALARAPAESPWASVKKLLHGRRAADQAAGAVPDLAFAVDTEFDGRGVDEVVEMPGAIVLSRAEPPFELVRLDAACTAVRVVLRSPPRAMGSNGHIALWGIDVEGGEAIFTLTESGEPNILPATARRPTVAVLDDGFWLFAAESQSTRRYVEIRRPDLSIAAKLRMPLPVPGGPSLPPLPRRAAGGWVISGVLDVNGAEVALSLFNDAFELIARSEGSGASRSVHLLADGAVLCSTMDASPVLERWVLEGERFTRAWALQCRTSVIAGGSLVVLSGDMLSALEPGGLSRWSIRHGGSLYLAAAGDLVVAYGGAAAVIVDAPSGNVMKRLQLSNAHAVPDVLVDATGALYLRDDRVVWILADGAVRRVPLPFAADLLTTAGDAALFGDPASGRHVLIGRDGGVRGGFVAKGAPFSVVGTRAGPYVIERRRFRALSFLTGKAGKADKAGSP